MKMPFRELDFFDPFLLEDGQKCGKIGKEKYLVYDELFEPVSLETADPNMMVELDEELMGEDDEEAVENEENFFYTLLDLLYGLEKQFEKAGQKLTIKSLRQFAKDFLWMPRD
jgi:hypothetical protein